MVHSPQGRFTLRCGDAVPPHLAQMNPSRQKSAVVRGENRVAPGRHAQLGVDGPDVTLHGVDRDRELVRDLPGVQQRRQQGENGEVTFTEETSGAGDPRRAGGRGRTASSRSLRSAGGTATTVARAAATCAANGPRPLAAARSLSNPWV